MKRIPIVIFLTAITIGLFLLFDKCSTTQPFKQDKQQAQQCVKQVNTNDMNNQNAIALMQKHGDSLQKGLYQTHLQLQQPQNSVATLSEKDTATEDIVKQFTDCDSLKEQVHLFANLFDSLKCDYEKKITQSNNLLAIKDSQIVINTTLYSQLKDSTDENLKLKQNLAKDLETAYEQQRKNRIQNKVLAAGFLILSGITATLFIDYRK